MSVALPWLLCDSPMLVGFTETRQGQMKDPLHEDAGVFPGQDCVATAAASWELVALEVSALAMATMGGRVQELPTASYQSHTKSFFPQNLSLHLKGLLEIAS